MVMPSKMNPTGNWLPQGGRREQRAPQRSVRSPKNTFSVSKEINCTYFRSTTRRFGWKRKLPIHCRNRESLAFRSDESTTPSACLAYSGPGRPSSCLLRYHLRTANHQGESLSPEARAGDPDGRPDDSDRATAAPPWSSHRRGVYGAVWQLLHRFLARASMRGRRVEAGISARQHRFHGAHAGDRHQRQKREEHFGIQSHRRGLYHWRAGHRLEDHPYLRWDPCRRKQVFPVEVSEHPVLSSGLAEQDADPLPERRGKPGMPGSLSDRSRSQE